MGNKFDNVVDGNKEYCPKCNSNLQGNPISKDEQYLFGATHFSRKIGLSNWDSVYAWKCPDCGHVWDRK